MVACLGGAKADYRKSRPSLRDGRVPWRSEGRLSEKSPIAPRLQPNGNGPRLGAAHHWKPSSPRVQPPRTRVNRRDLLGLRPRAAPTAAEPGDDNVAPGRADLGTVSRPAMGSYFEVRLPSSTPGAVDLACRALDLIDALEAQLTVYRDDSEVSRL